jgi:signal transduction histidine kinase
MPDNYRTQHLEAVDRYLDTGQRTIDWSAVEFPGLHKDGHELPLSISFGEFELDGDRRFIGIIRDVSDQKRRERDLQQQTERLDQFASMLSHDLQNPLSIALHHLELYREEGQESDLDGLEEALHRIEDLTVELTSLARHGDGSDEGEPVSLATIAEEAWDVIDQREARLETDDATITGNRVQFGALFENLFRNAVGHGGQDVTIRVGPLDEGFYVEDTGTGIPAEDRETVFEHGYSTGYGGSGIGLSLVRRVATANGFVVTLTESDEGGARFEFHRSGS